LLVRSQVQLHVKNESHLTDKCNGCAENITEDSIETAISPMVTVLRPRRKRYAKRGTVVLPLHDA